MNKEMITKILDDLRQLGYDVKTAEQLEQVQAAASQDSEVADAD